MALKKIVNGVEVDLTEAEALELLTEWQNNDLVKQQDLRVNGYKKLRKKAYPSIEDQLDIIFHEGVDGWKARIQLIKDLYPKPIAD